MSSKLYRVPLIILAWMALFPSEAWAYLDPGTGSLIVQSVIAAVAAVGFGLRLYWGRLRTWLRRAGKSEDSTPRNHESPGR